jgi:CRISPR/Cas system Type II protein with McrA/HNH and RuvC-like nuclease domain
MVSVSQKLNVVHSVEGKITQLKVLGLALFYWTIFNYFRRPWEILHNAGLHSKVCKDTKQLEYWEKTFRLRIKIWSQKPKVQTDSYALYSSRKAQGNSGHKLTKCQEHDLKQTGYLAITKTSRFLR